MGSESDGGGGADAPKGAGGRPHPQIPKPGAPAKQPRTSERPSFKPLPPPMVAAPPSAAARKVPKPGVTAPRVPTPGSIRRSAAGSIPPAPSPPRLRSSRPSAPLSSPPEPSAPVPAPPAPSELEPEASIEAAPLAERGGAIEPPVGSQQGDSAEQPTSYRTLARFGRFGLLGRLATGGMADIFLGRESAEHGASRFVVIKVVRGEIDEQGEFAQMFLDEGRIAMRLTHPNICTVYECGREAGRFFIAMEYVEGTTLRDLVIRATKREEKLPVPIVVKLFAQLAEALDLAHREVDAERRPLNIVHRDVSPQNLMVRYDGVVKLLDFGVAKAEHGIHETQDGAVKGKFSYMSPEQARNLALDGRSDLFSLAICLFEALTARRLFRGKTQFDTLKAVLEQPVPPLSRYRDDVPPGLDGILNKALAKNRDDRYQRGAELQHDLEQLLGEMKEVVGTHRVGELMERLYGEEMRRGPVLETTGLERRFPTLSFDLPDPTNGSLPLNALGVGWRRAAAIGGAVVLASLLFAVGLSFVGGDEDTPAVATAPTTAIVPANEAPVERTGPRAEPGPEQVDSPTVEQSDPRPEEPTGEATDEPTGEATDDGPAEEPTEGPSETNAAGSSATEGPEGQDGSRTRSFERLREQARAHFAARRFGAAARAYEEAVALNPGHAGSFAGLGAASLALGQHARAIRAYRRATQLQPNVAGFHAALGNAYQASGDANRARGSFERALRLNPDNQTARRGLQALR